MSVECAECEQVVYAGHAPSCSRRCQVFSSESGLQCDRGVRHPDDHQRFNDEGDEVVESWAVRVDLVAAFVSRCSDCDGWIEAGSRIRRHRLDAPGWAHAVCPAGRMDLQRTVCGECFTERSVTGACMCEQVTV